MNSNAQRVEKHMGIEVYRLFSMFFIILFHFSDHGAVIINNDMPMSGSWLLMAFFRCWGAMGNCAFVLITGYFMINKKQNIKRLIKLWFEVWIYSLVLGSISFMLGTEQFSLWSLLKMIFPVIFNEYWFMSSYVILFLVSPYINKMILTLTKKEFQTLIVILVVVFSVIPTLTGTKWMTDANYIMSFLTMYVIGGYIRLYGINLFKKKYLYCFCAIGLTLLMFISILVFKKLNLPKALFYFVWGMNKIPVILASIMWFLTFISLKKIKYNKIINFASSSVFGVYLLHIGRLNKWIFGKLFNTTLAYNAGGVTLFIQLVIWTISIFVCGVLIDKIRIYCFEKPFFRVVKRCQDVKKD